MGSSRETTSDFWQEHSLTFLEMAFRTDRHGRSAQPSGIGRNVGACQDSITLFVNVRDETIETIAYELEGCLNTNACANALAGIVEGHPVESAWQVTPEMVAAYLQTLPTDHVHCAELVVGAFYKALADYQQNGRKNWQAAYRRPA